ncbi:P-loop containing nucleoside triphosphate hydrolase protein [Tilletiaria anomala UBC 951]|uniref:p-loop containing nucleoside triphosphate hydrolase protein n=1 Tax=Tilletiaria anomala (strain ATCC 24038 / CBS 436.72 / UBC 951) TaxID=1037660 RepID=A0A066VDS0_TILAU|nr:P-loop containing nucleoside triphosphate hydrolase protein [Tilletiaria anomala UBC 951]KDN39857.1 P-loop containing nucleoside triphosphate hydrolase protein [Tilletiaria anomala UBC 951]
MTKYDHVWDLNRYDPEEQSRIDALKRRPPAKWMLEGRPTGGRSGYLEVMREGSGLSGQMTQQQFNRQDSSFRRKLRKVLSEYRNRTTELLEAEKASREQTLSLRKTWSFSKLVERGLAISDLQAYWLSSNARHYGKRVAVFRKVGMQSFGWNKLRPGDCVVLTPQEALGESILLEEPVIEGTLIDKGRTRVRVAFDEKYAQVDVEGVLAWRMDQGSNDLFERRIERALEAIEHDVDFIESLAFHDSQVRLSGCKVIDAVLGIPPPPTRRATGAFSQNSALQDWLSRISHSLQKSQDPQIGLNTSQVKAIAAMLGNRISLIQGPPGTGKTRTIAEAVHLLKSHFKVHQPILLTAHTNVAVDNLAEGAVNRGLKVVRTGASARTRPKLREHSLEALAGQHPLMPELIDVRRHIARLQLRLGFSLDSEEGGDADSLGRTIGVPIEASGFTMAAQPERLTSAQAADLRGKLARGYRHAYVLWRRITRSILLQADVICATAVSSCSNDLEQIDFPVVFFDEGSMATEPTSLIPLIKGCQHLAIIGDHKQLPPVVASLDAKLGGLGISLFERLINEKAAPSVMLNEQYRMHPAIAEFPNETFYEGALLNALRTHGIAPLHSRFFRAEMNAQSRTSTSAAGATTAALGPTHHYLSFVNHTGTERKVDDSVQNRAEAKLTMQVVVDLLLRNPELQGHQIGIVTPYLAQVLLLESLLRGNLKQSWADQLGPRASALGEVDVHTVDGFEGREKAAIIFSTVRSNSDGYVGFLADARRLNVALTRAQRALFVLGDLRTLDSAKVGDVGMQTIGAADLDALRAYAKYVRDKDVVVEARDVLATKNGP